MNRREFLKGVVAAAVVPLAVGSEAFAAIDMASGESITVNQLFRFNPVTGQVALLISWCEDQVLEVTGITAEEFFQQ